MGNNITDFFIALQRIAEEKIVEAMKNGEFDNLPGKGKPVNLNDDANIPPELRVAYRILKNAGYVSEEVNELREINNLKDMLEDCEDEQEMYRKIQKLNLMVMKMNERRKVPVYLEVEQVYYRKVLEKVKVKKIRKR